MPESSSPAVRRREKADRSTKAALSATRDVVVPQLTTFFTPYVREGETPIDFGYLWDLFHRAIDGAETMVVEKDQTHLEKKAVVTERRKQKKDDTKATRGQLVNIRRNLEGGYGPDADERVGYAGPVPEETIAVLRLAKIVGGHFDDFEDLKLIPLENGSGEIDEKTTTKLKENTKKLEESVTALSDAERESEQAQLIRQEALPDHDRIYDNVGRIAEGFSRLVKEDERADRMRISYRSVPRKSKNEEEPRSGEAQPAPSEPVVTA